MDTSALKEAIADFCASNTGEMRRKAGYISYGQVMGTHTNPFASP